MIVWTDSMDILPAHGPHSGGAARLADSDADEGADGVADDWPDLVVGQPVVTVPLEPGLERVQR